MSCGKRAVRELSHAQGGVTGRALQVYRPPHSNRAGRGSVSLLRIPTKSLDPGSFDDGDVAIDGKIGKRFRTSARLRPADLQFVHFLLFAEAQHFAGIMRRKITPASDLEFAAFHISGLPCDSCADGVRV